MRDDVTPLAIAVVIPVRNMAGPLRQCLTALGASTVRPSQVIVVDDASTDDAVATVARAFGATVVRLPSNQGPAAARNAGAVVADGEYLLFLDADTAVFPETIARALAAIKRWSADAVCGIYARTPLNDGFAARYYSLLKHESHRQAFSPRYNVLASHCAMIRRDVFWAAGGFTPFRPGVDIENEECGRRIAARWTLVLDPAVEVRHHFSAFWPLTRKLARRAFWWTRYFLQHRTFESALTTRGFALGTVAAPVLVGSVGMAVWSGHPAAWGWWGLATLAGFGFWRGYGPLMRQARHDGGWGFALGALGASVWFSIAISVGAGLGVLSALIPLKMVGAPAVIPRTAPRSAVEVA